MAIEIIEKLKTGKIGKSEIIRLLKARGDLQKELFKQAKQIRQKYFGNKIYVRGVVEISNYCRKNCDYCAMRYSNKKLKRYRLTPKEIFSTAKQIKELGIQTLFIQAGEDPNIDKIIKEVLPKIKKELKINNIILCLGDRSKEQYKRFKQFGANAYILKFETSDSKLFQKITYYLLKQRLQCLKWLKELKFEVGTGNITGLPEQTIQSIADDILLAKKLNTDFVSTAPFIPNDNTPFENKHYGDINLTLNTMAILRIMLKNVLIPTVSALEKIKKGGQYLGFDAGANVITINFTPQKYRKKYLIYSKKRFVVSINHALNTIRLADLKPDMIRELPRKTIPPFFDEKWKISEEKKLRSVYYRTNPGAKTFIRLLKNKRGVNVLDLGCGDGRFTIKYVQAGFKTLGIDFSLNAIKRLIQRAKGLNLSHLVKGKVADITKFNYGNNKFDGVSCCNTLHYFNIKELKKIIERMKKATKKDGLNYIAFECNIDMELPDGRKFQFEVQPYRSVEDTEKILKTLYKDWRIIKLFKSENNIRAPLPENIRKLLKTKSTYYKRYFTVVDFITKKVK